MIAALLLGAALLAQAEGLRIVVVDGEDAVNIIQQKTAVRPVVEVRDRNNLPVPGALVTFSIEGGKAASFGGASTLTVATNAAGQAAVTGLTPSAAGAFQIQVQAAFQGQVATATIAQTNVMTAAQAAAVSGASGASGAGGATGAPGAGGAGGAGGAAGGAGGGLSATTLGVVGAAVGGGALVATQVAGKEEPTTGAYSGTFTGQVTSTMVGVVTCTVTRTVNGAMTVMLDVSTATTISGRLEASGTDTVVSQTCDGPAPTTTFSRTFTLSGTPASFGFNDTRSESRPADNDPRQTVQSTTNVVFQGSLNGNAIAGNLTIDERSETTGECGCIVRESSSGTFPIALTKK